MKTFLSISQMKDYIEGYCPSDQCCNHWDIMWRLKTLFSADLRHNNDSSILV